MRRPVGTPIFGAALSSDDSTGRTSAYPRRHPLVKIHVRVGTSSIAGQGLFAGQEIKQGTKIIRYIGERITHEENEWRLAAGNAYIFGLDERSAIDGSTPKNTARSINHLGLSLQVPPGKISRRERGDLEDVHVSTLL